MYRDDSLAFLKSTNGPEAKKLKRKFQKLFKGKDLDITVQCNLEITNFRDIRLNLNDGSYHPYRKLDEETNYIHVNSDHPPSIIKEIPRSIEKRPSILSPSKNIFQESVVYYEKSLKNNGCKTIQNKKKRKRNIIWFNPPYSKSARTNIARIFIKLINKHFPPNHKFIKIFNKNTIKLSFCCMRNIRSKTNGHNKKILQPKPKEQQKLCNCLVKEDFPMNELCSTSSISYQATIKCSDSKYKQKRYKGICETTFKKCYANHKKSFNLVKSRNDTALSVEYWTLKQKQQALKLTWKIKGQCKAYNPTLKKCNFYLNEKFQTKVTEQEARSNLSMPPLKQI